MNIRSANRAVPHLLTGLPGLAQRLAGTVAGYLLLFAVPLLVAATEGGGSNYLPGFYGDFGMAVGPTQGTLLNNFFAAYQDVHGRAGALIEMPALIQATGYKLLGGNYLLALYPSLVAANDTGTRQSRVGVGDAYVVPAALNWHWRNGSLLIFEGIVAPSGYYRQGALNAGRNVWTFDNVLALTWQLPAGNELSLALGYMNNLENTATSYQSGDEIHVDVTFGHYLDPQVAVGIAGSYYRQVNADHAPAAILAAEQSQASAIGQVLLFAPKLADRDVSISLKWLHEFNVDGRTAQDYLLGRVLLGF